MPGYLASVSVDPNTKISTTSGEVCSVKPAGTNGYRQRFPKHLSTNSLDYGTNFAISRRTPKRIPKSRNTEVSDCYRCRTSSGGIAQSASGSRSDIVWADFIIAYSALEFCPQNVPLSKRFVADYTEQQGKETA